MTYIALLTYPILWLAFLASRRPLMSPIGIFIVFYHMHYGPQSFYVDMMRISINLPGFVNDEYIWFISGSNIALALALFMVGTRPSAHFVKMAEVVPDYVDFTKVSAYILIYGVLHLLLDLPSFSRTIEHLNFFLGRSSMTYEQIRRVAFVDNFWQIGWNYTRNTLTPISYALLAIAFLKRKNDIIGRANLLFIAIATYVMTSISLTKFVYAYTALIIMLVILIYQRNSLNLSGRAIVWLMLAAATSLGSIQALYFIQYGDALTRGYLSEDSLFSVLWYRAFFAQADALRLWLLEFPDQTPHIGFSNIGVLARLFDLEYLDPTLYLPIKYLGDGLTTLQTGFLGSTYASFGYVYTYLYAVIIIICLEYAHRVGCRIVFRDLRAVYFAVLLPNTYFLNSREVSVALFSGGVLLAPVIVLILYRVGLNKLRRSRGRSMSMV